MCTDKSFAINTAIFLKNGDIRPTSEQWIHGLLRCSSHPVICFPSYLFKCAIWDEFVHFPHTPKYSIHAVNSTMLPVCSADFLTFLFHFHSVPFYICGYQRRHWGLEKQVCHAYYVYGQIPRCISLDFYSIFQTDLNPGIWFCHSDVRKLVQRLYQLITCAKPVSCTAQRCFSHDFSVKLLDFDVEGCCPKLLRF